MRELPIEYIERHVGMRLARYLETFRVVQVTGPRQSGKSTLARRSSAAERMEVTFDDPDVRERASADPYGFLRTLGTGDVLIDEAQRVPEIYLAIKRVVDTDDRPGRYLLTGSSDARSDLRILDSLAGRIGIVDLRPLSQGELAGRDARFLERAFRADPDPAWLAADLDGAPAYLPRIIAGGYPEAVGLDDPMRMAWVESYLEATFARDVRDHVAIADLGRLRRLFDLVASNSGQLLKGNALARDIDASANTVRSWLEALRLTRLVDLVPAWTGGRRGRLVATPRGYVVDTGLLAGALGVDSAGILRDAMLLGGFVETFAVQEVLRQLTWSGVRVRAHHYRDRDQREVDLVLERADGQLVGVEVKAASRVRPGDAAGLRALRRAAGGRMVRGIVLYCGTLPLELEPGIVAVPLANLWTT